MGLRDRVRSFLSTPTDRADTTEETASIIERVHVHDLDVDRPKELPEVCPNCGESFDERDVMPPGPEKVVVLGEHTHVCVLGSQHAGPLAGWRVVHR